MSLLPPEGSLEGYRKCLDRQQWQKAQGVYTIWSSTRTYLNISVDGRNSTRLLDTGCDLSTLPCRFVPCTPIAPTYVTVYAANGTKIPVMGTVTTDFEVEGVPVK